MKLVWSPDALRQLEHAVYTIAQDDPAAALRVHARIVERSQELQRFQNLGTEGRKPGTRELVVTGTPYILVYRVKDEEIHILHAWHGKQSRRYRR